MSCNRFRKIKKTNRCFDHIDELILANSKSEDEKYDSIIAHYKATHSERDKHLADIKNAAKIENAIVLAATARDAEGRKHGHQNLIPPSDLQQFSDSILMRKDDIVAADSFGQLYNIIKESKVEGVGDLCIYDTAHRLGHYLGLSPDVIYLHRGTKEGATKLIGKIKEAYISKDMLPVPFQREDLSNSELEDILCIYKKYF